MKYTQTFKEALQQVREDGHTDVASAVRQCKTTIEDASQMLSKLQGMNPEDNLPSWWMNKIAIAANSMNKLRDYLLVPSTNEAKEEPVVEPKEDKSAGEIQTLKNKIQQFVFLIYLYLFLLQEQSYLQDQSYCLFQVQVCFFQIQVLLLLLRL